MHQTDLENKQIKPNSDSSVTPIQLHISHTVTISKKGNFILFDAHFSALSEYAGPVITLLARYLHCHKVITLTIQI
jgi:hypothetical protein